ncbi:hypothetical protein ACOME3_003602 [Neoechinorhynchus agilis]
MLLNPQLSAMGTPRDAIMFIGVEIWPILFNHSITKLLTKDEKVFVICDYEHKWTSPVLNKSEQLLVGFTCNLTRSILQNLGFECRVRTEPLYAKRMNGLDVLTFLIEL